MNRLREARTYIGLSHAEVEGAMNLSTMALEDMEEGAMEPSGIQWEAFSTLYQRPMGWLRGDPENEDDLEWPQEALFDFARGGSRQLSDADALEVTRFAQFLRHRAQQRAELPRIPVDDVRAALRAERQALRSITDPGDPDRALPTRESTGRNLGNLGDATPPPGLDCQHPDACRFGYCECPLTGTAERIGGEG